jgi:hypothetical protein
MISGMNSQNQIKRTLSKSSNIEYVRSLLERNKILNRSQLAEAVCEQLGFHDVRGVKPLSGCLKALRTLEAAGHFVLPESRQTTASGPGSLRRLSEAVALSLDVPARVDDVSGLALILVTSLDHMRIWNELMIGEHPQDAGLLVGRQLLYLIASEHGWLGGLGFGSAALQLADRDKCLRWYVPRWRIEDLAHATAERLCRTIASLVIAWRIMLMTLLGRETPELPAEILFSDIELRTLGAYAKKTT